MTAPQTAHPGRTIANIFGTLGYVSLALQWAWALIILAYPIITDQHSILFRHDAPPALPVATVPTGPIVMIVASVVTVLILALTVVTILKLPKTIGRTGAKITHATSNLIIPAIVHHQPISKKRRMRLSYRIMLILKLSLILLPVASLVFAPHIQELPSDAILVVGAFCAVGTVVYFGLQYLIAHFCHVAPNDVW